MDGIQSVSHSLSFGFFLISSIRVQVAIFILSQMVTVMSYVQKQHYKMNHSHNIPVPIQAVACKEEHTGLTA